MQNLFEFLRIKLSIEILHLSLRYLSFVIVIFYFTEHFFVIFLDLEIYTYILTIYMLTVFIFSNILKY